MRETFPRTRRHPAETISYLAQEDDTAKVAQVIKRLTGRREPLPTPPEVPSPPSPLSLAPLPERSRAKVTAVKKTAVETTTVKITPVKSS